MKKKTLFILALIILLSNTNALASGEFLLWNMLRGKGYGGHMITNEDMKEINNDSRLGHKFYKRIAGKLVSFDDYYNELVQEYIRLSEQETDEEEIINNLVSNISIIVSNLDDLEYDTKPIMKSSIVNGKEMAVEGNNITLILNNNDIINLMEVNFNHPVRIKSVNLDGRQISVDKHKDNIELYFGIKDVHSFSKQITLTKPLLNIREILSEFGNMEIEVENESGIATVFVVILDNINRVSSPSVGIEKYLPQFFK